MRTIFFLLVLAIPVWAETPLDHTATIPPPRGAPRRVQIPVSAPHDAKLCEIERKKESDPAINPAIPSSAAVRKQFEGYLQAMSRGLKGMDRDDHLPKDTVFYTESEQGLRANDWQTFSGPTDIGMKLVAHVGLLKYQHYRAESLNQLGNILDTLEKLPYQKATGLFFRLYGSVSEPGPRPISPVALNNAKAAHPVVDADLSAIDNFHLYLGLYTLSRSQNPGMEKVAQRARTLFDRMHFSEFYDPQTKTMGGNLKYHREGASDKWRLEAYRAGFNSELRQTLTGLYALNGLHDKYPGSLPLAEILRQVPMEFDSEGQLMTWVGGGFESDLTPINLAESRISCAMAKSSQVRRHRIFQKDLVTVTSAEGNSKQVPHLPSATITRLVNDAERPVVTYEGKVGKSENKVSANGDPINSSIIVPHALLLLAAEDPQVASAPLKNLETVGEGQNGRLYHPELGWLVSARLEQTPAGVVGKVNLGQTAVDGYFSLVGILTALDKDHLSPSAQAILADPEAARRLNLIYGIVDRRYRQVDIFKLVSTAETSRIGVVRPQ